MRAADAVDRDRLLGTLRELRAIDRPPGSPDPLGDEVVSRLTALGCRVERDPIGNVIAHRPGRPAAARPMLLAVHGNASGTAGLADLLELLAVLVADPAAEPPPLEIVVTVGGEPELRGVRALDSSRLRADHGFLLATTDPVGTITYDGPAAAQLSVTIRGRRAAATMDPERGISAIEVAADAITRMELGRVDGDTVANVGTIRGGESAEVIPDVVHLEGMVRSRTNERLDRQVEAMTAAIDGAVARWRASATIERDDLHRAFRLAFDSRPFLAATRAAEALGLPVRRHHGSVGTDANAFNAAGIPCVTLSTGGVSIGAADGEGPAQDLVDGCRHLVQIVTQPSLA